MTKPQITWNWDVNVGTVVTAVIQIAVLVAGLIGAYVQFTTKMDTAIATTQEEAQAIKQLNHQTIRIEHYLSSKDPSYWQTVRQLDEGDDSTR